MAPTNDTTVTNEEFESANQRAEERLKNTPRATAAKYDRRISRIVISLSTGVELAFSPHWAQGLETAKPDQLEDIEITPSGLGIHFPTLDADLYLPALLEGALGSRHWIARQLGAKGGRMVTPAKAAAAKENGKLGGRPKKKATAA
jgi:hypothetical protein